MIPGVDKERTTSYIRAIYSFDFFYMLHFDRSSFYRRHKFCMVKDSDDLQKRLAGQKTKAGRFCLPRHCFLYEEGHIPFMAPEPLEVSG